MSVPVFNDSVIEVLTSEVRVTSGGQNFENNVVNGEKGHIEGSSTDIADNDLPLAVILVKTVEMVLGDVVEHSMRPVHADKEKETPGSRKCSLLVIGVSRVLPRRH